MRNFGINQVYQIKQLDNITDTKLIIVTLDETSENYLFKDWSDTKILCYCYQAKDKTIAIYPYVNIDKIIEKEILALQAQVIELELEKIRGVK